MNDFKSILSRFRRKNTALLTLVSGTALAQAITFAVSPLLSRLYTPLEFGELAIFMFCLSAVQVVACARYEMAIVIAESDEEANTVAGLSWVITIFFAILTLIFAALYAFVLPQMAQYPHLAGWFWLMPIAILGLGAYMIFAQMLVRGGQYGSMSSARLVQSSSNNGIQVLLGFLKTGATGLFVGTIVSSVVYGGTLFLLFYKKSTDFTKNWSAESFAKVAKKYESLPRTTFFQSLLEMYQANILSFLLPLLYGAAAGGYYFRTLIIFQAPVSLLGQALAQVTYKEMAVLWLQNAPLQPFLRSTMRKAAFLMLPLSAALLLGAPSGFALLFGEQWRSAGEYARILAPWMYFDFIRVTIVQVCIIIKKQKELLYFSIFSGFLLFFSLYIAYLYTNDVYQSLICLSATMTVFTIFLLFWLDRLTAAK